MKKNKISLLSIALLVMAFAFSGCTQNQNVSATTSSTVVPTPISTPTPTAIATPLSTQAATATTPVSSIVYKNTTYGFGFTLPASWKGYKIITSTWTGQYIEDPSHKGSITGPRITIRHPNWTSSDPRQDIPIMVFTLSQWASIEKETLSVSAAPIGPTELGRNSKYVFALPARYNYAFPTGYEEVEQIMNSNPLKPN